MIGLDTNVLVRYLTRDDEQQWQQAVKLIEGEECFITNVVVCELIWVLRGKPYQFGKDEILKAVEAMLQSTTFEFENRSAVYQALQRTRQGSGDFSDYLIGAIARQHDCLETATFDRKLRKEKGFKFLSQD